MANSDTLDESEIVHLGKNFQNECSLFIQTGKKSHKTLWDSGACKCVISLESYQTNTSWSAPIVVVPKGDGGKRLCIDYRALNAITRTFIWPMPRVEDILAKLGKEKFFTTFDLRSGYHHIALDKESIKKIAFCTPFGKYEYLKVPFGLAQTPSYFHKLMNKVLNGLNFAFAYLDDIIFSNTAEEHLKHIQIIINRLGAAQIKFKKSKCSFFKKELYYLGYLLTTEGIKPQIEKVKAIHEMKPPTTQKRC